MKSILKKTMLLKKFIAEKAQLFDRDKATAEYQRTEDIVRDWLDECCQQDPDGIMRAREAHDSFSNWHKTNIGREIPSVKFLGSQLSRFAQRRKDVAGRYYLGWRLITGGL